MTFQYGVRFDDGEHYCDLGDFRTIEEAAACMKEEITEYLKPDGRYSDCEYYGEEDEEFDFELVKVDELGLFTDSVGFWSESNGYDQSIKHLFQIIN